MAAFWLFSLAELQPAAIVGAAGCFLASRDRGKYAVRMDGIFGFKNGKVAELDFTWEAGTAPSHVKKRMFGQAAGTLEKEKRIAYAERVLHNTSAPSRGKVDFITWPVSIQPITSSKKIRSKSIQASKAMIQCKNESRTSCSKRRFKQLPFSRWEDLENYLLFNIFSFRYKD